MPELIPKVIGEDEKLIRCIGHEIYYSSSKQRVSSSAFFPPSGSNEVSLLRLDYTNENRCKLHAKSLKIGNYNYCGLTLTRATEMLISDDNFKYKEGDLAETNVVATPLDKDSNIRDFSEEIGDSDEGLPFHADLIYNWTAIEGKTAPNVIKRIAKKISQNPPTLFFQDSNIESNDWTGGSIEF